MVPVEDICNGNGPYRDSCISDQRHQKGRDQRVPPDRMKRPAVGGGFRASVSGSCVFADNRLDALADAGEDRHKHKRDIGENTVRCHSCIPVKGEDQEVKHNDHDAGGQLGDQGGYTKGADILPAPQGEADAGHRAEAVVLLYKVYGRHKHSEQWSGRRGDGGSGHSHIQRVDEDIVQHDIRKAARDHGCHGEPGRAVISHEAGEQVVPQKERGEYQEDAEIVCRVPDGISVCAQQARDRPRDQCSGG